MSDADVELGPIDYLVVEWPAGKQPSGEGLPLLVDLVDRGVIRLLDLAFVRKDDDGSVIAVDLSDFGDGPELTVFEGASSGLLGPDDYDEAGARSSRDAPPPCSSTRTRGRPRSRPRSAAAARSSSRTAASP